MACEKIVAEPGTLTGSIGVISQFPNFTALATKYDFKMETVKSGKLKDAGNPFREMTPDDRAYWQSMIDRVYKQFVKAVAESRKLPEAKVREFADGRVLTGDQALELGLIDQLGNFHDAVDLVASMANLKGEPHLIYPPDERAKLFESMLGGVVHGIAEEVRAEVRAETSPGRPGLYFMTFLGQ
jgi:protease-4